MWHYLATRLMNCYLPTVSIECFVVQAFNKVLFTSQSQSPIPTTLRTPEGIVLTLHKSTIADEKVQE